MFGFIGKIFGSEKAIGGAIGTVGKALDALHYSDEEKQAVRMKFGELVVDWIDRSRGQYIVRRAIAIAIVSVWLGLYLLAGFFMSLAILLAGFPERKTQMNMTLDMARLSFEMSNGIAGYVMLIVAFYFAAPHLGQVVTPALAAIKESMKGGNKVDDILKHTNKS